MTLDVDLDTLASIATSLDSASTGIEGLDASPTSAVDAGPMTAVITGMLSQIVESGGNVSDALAGSAATVRECRTYYQRADASAQADLAAIHRAMTP